MQVDAVVEIDVVVDHAGAVRAAAQLARQDVVDRAADRGGADAAGIEALRLDALGHRRHAVIGRQPDDVVALADVAIELVEQQAELRVEMDQHVLDFVRVGTEVVADLVERGEADARENRWPAPRPSFIASIAVVGERGEVCIRDTGSIPTHR